MRFTASLPLLSLLTAFAAGCAVEAAPPEGPASAPVAASEAHPELIERCPADEIPFAPVTCAPVFFSATTPDNSYASTCSGQATIELATPTCSAGTDYAWDIVPGGWANLTSVYSKLPAVQCNQVYVDTKVSIQSASTGVWQELSSGRAYGRFENGACQVPVPSSQRIPQTNLAAIEISADAYEPAYWGNLFLGMYPVPFTFRVTSPD